MITLYAFGPAFGLPDASPFVTKAEILLKMAKQPYRVDTTGFRRAPKGKLPYIEDSGVVIADSTFIRLHLEKKYAVAFDQGLSPAERGIAWAVEKMLEDHLYFFLAYERWMKDANFLKGPARFFDAAPALLRPIIRFLVRRKVARDILGQGTGRHTDAERVILAEKCLTSVADILGDKNYLMGAEPCGADATAYAFVLGVLCPHFAGPLQQFAASQTNLVAYCERMKNHYA